MAITSPPPVVRILMQVFLVGHSNATLNVHPIPSSSISTPAGVADPELPLT